MAVSFRLDPAASVCLVHDVVNDFVADFVDPALPGFDPDLCPVIDNIARLLDASRSAAIPVVFAAPGQGLPEIGPNPAHKDRTRLVWGTPGVDVISRLSPLPGDTVIRKPRYGAFFGSHLAEHLRDQKRDTIILCGLSLAGGVETTVRDAHNRDLRTVLVADSCLTRAVPDQGWGPVSREEVLKVKLSIFAQRFARVASTDDICGELAAANATPSAR